MSNQNYFENISLKLGRIVKYFRVLRLIVIIAYLIFLATLVIDVFSAVEYVPTSSEVKGRFLPITAKNDVIGSIERYFLSRENSLDKNLQKEITKNPFAPHELKQSILTPAESPVVSENFVVTPMPVP